jgi:hypothetical protein
MSDLDRPASEATSAPDGAAATNNSAAMPAEPGSINHDVAGTLLKICALVISLWVAIGAACEILNRNQDYDRVSNQYKALIACREAKEKVGCKSSNELEGWIGSASIQMQRYNSLNANGAWDRCHTAAVFASTESSFFEDCVKLLRRTERGTAARLTEPGKKEGQTAASLGAFSWHPVTANREIDRIDLAEEKLNNDENEFVLLRVLSPHWASYSGGLLAFDQAAKDHLYFLLVLVSTVIGTLIAALRDAGKAASPPGLVASARQLAVGIGAGFAVYVLLRGGNFVFFSGASVMDVLNPFSAAAAGFLVGLYSERVFKFLEHTVPGAHPPSSQSAGSS